jgi:hypothetical protein
VGELAEPLCSNHDKIEYNTVLIFFEKKFSGLGQAHFQTFQECSSAEIPALEAILQNLDF